MRGACKIYFWRRRVTDDATLTIRIDQRDSLDKVLGPPSSVLPVTRINALILSPARPYRSNDLPSLIDSELDQSPLFPLSSGI